MIHCPTSSLPLRYRRVCIQAPGDLLGSLPGHRLTSMATNSGTGSHSNGSAPLKINGWTRKDRPCDACRRRKSRCIIPEGTEVCLMCQSRAEECTFVQSPQRRKRRKVETSENSPEANKPRYISSIIAGRKPRAFANQILTDHQMLSEV
jgi:hypothetical protein